MKSFIKWPGGKKQLLTEIKSRMPKSFNNYFEPFIGGGALFFDLENETKNTINDLNKELINTYRVIRDHPLSLINELNEYKSVFNNLENESMKSEYYYQMRDFYNSFITKDNLDTNESIKEAALLIFLNKTCFNGLYRVNRKGLFNSPFGKKTNVNLINPDNILEISDLLGNTNILNYDFSLALKDVQQGDFVFIDSPYYDTFDTYQSEGFKESDHIRLFELFKELDKKGAYLMLTNSNTDFIKNLYKDYKIDIVNVKRMINRDANNRVGKEVIITNY